MPARQDKAVRRRQMKRPADGPRPNHSTPFKRLARDVLQARKTLTSIGKLFVWLEKPESSCEGILKGVIEEHPRLFCPHHMFHPDENIDKFVMQMNDSDTLDEALERISLPVERVKALLLIMKQVSADDVLPILLHTGLRVGEEPQIHEGSSTQAGK